MLQKVIKSFSQIIAVIGIFVFLIISCALFRKAEDNCFAETSMFCQIEDNSYWTVYYHKETKVMYLRNKGMADNDFEVLIDADGKPILWER